MLMRFGHCWWRRCQNSERHTDPTAVSTAIRALYTTEQSDDRAETAYPADRAQDDLRFPDEREDVERPSGRLAGSVRAAAVHRTVVGPSDVVRRSRRRSLIENSTGRPRLVAHERR